MFFLKVISFNTTLTVHTNDLASSILHPGLPISQLCIKVKVTFNNLLNFTGGFQSNFTDRTQKWEILQVI
jgi:hypothetical protein